MKSSASTRRYGPTVFGRRRRGAGGAGAAAMQALIAGASSEDWFAGQSGALCHYRPGAFSCTEIVDWHLQRAWTAGTRRNQLGHPFRRPRFLMSKGPRGCMISVRVVLEGSTGILSRGRISTPIARRTGGLGLFHPDLWQPPAIEALPPASLGPRGVPWVVVGMALAERRGPAARTGVIHTVLQRPERCREGWRDPGRKPLPDDGDTSLKLLVEHRGAFIDNKRLIPEP